MRYSVKNDLRLYSSIIELIADNRGLTMENIEELIKPTVAFENLPYGISNISLGVELLVKHIQKDSKYGILVDPDVDGYTSSTLMYHILVDECNIPKECVRFFFHEGKQHGLNDKTVFKEICNSDVDLVITPDSSSNDIEEIEKLIKLGKDVLCLDHHVCNHDHDGEFRDEGNFLRGVIVNNQINEVSSALSGVGVVYKFAVALLNKPLDKYLDLVGVGGIADSMNINDKELRYYVHEGLNNINNVLFKEYTKDEDNVTPMFMSFNMINYINGCIRYGKKEEKEDLFRAMIGEEGIIEYKKRGSTEVVEQTLQEGMCRISKNAKSRQDTQKKKCITKCVEYIETNELENEKVIVIVDETGKMVDSRIIGLVCMGLSDTYKRSVILLRKNGKSQYGGSARAYGIKNFKDIVETTEIIDAIGHQGAFGVFIDKSNMPRLYKRIREAMEGIEIVDNGHEVDCELDLDKLTKKDLKNLMKYDNLWFQGCQSPKFIIKDIEINAKRVKQPYPLLTIFTYKDFNFKKEFCRNSFFGEFTHSDEIRFGSPELLIDLIVELKKDKYGMYFSIVDYDSRVVANKRKEGECGTSKFEKRVEEPKRKNMFGRKSREDVDF